MLRQKKLSLQNSTVNHSLNLFLNQNFIPNTHTQEIKNCNSLKTHHRPPTGNQPRQGLRQIDLNHSNNVDLPNDTSCISTNKLQLNFGKKFTVGKSKQQDPLFDKIIQLIKNQELKLPSSYPSKPKKMLFMRERPSTSLSIQKTKSTEQTQECQGQVVFQLNKKNQEENQNNTPKISTSRALMNFSKVLRNGSGQRFKVRKGKNAYRNSVHLQAQKIVLHSKQKKEKYNLVHSIQKSVMKPQIPREVLKTRKNRYADQQQFQLAGWEYFQ